MLKELFTYWWTSPGAAWILFRSYSHPRSCPSHCKFHWSVHRDNYGTVMGIRWWSYQHRRKSRSHIQNSWNIFSLTHCDEPRWLRYWNQNRLHRRFPMFICPCEDFGRVLCFYPGGVWPCQWRRCDSMPGLVFWGRPLLWRDISVTIKGGYVCDYAATKGASRTESMVIRDGSMTIDGMVIQWITSFGPEIIWYG